MQNSLSSLSFTQDKITNPQETANQFAEYYGALYNLRNDPHTPPNAP